MYQNHISIQRFSKNTDGRDFIAGDIHGCFDELNSCLESLNFNPKTDRLFAVGDIIDRGPGSHKVMSWLKQPWFHSCLGNHEDMILTTEIDNKEDQGWFQSYGGHWWLELADHHRPDIKNAFKNLPLAIELETIHGKVGIVHADIPEGMSWSGFTRLLSMGDQETRNIALWGRSRIKRRIATPVKGIDRIVCGHTVTPKRQVIIKANVWFIETGAFLEDDASHLTVICVDELFK